MSFKSVTLSTESIDSFVRFKVALSVIFSLFTFKLTISPVGTKFKAIKPTTINAINAIINPIINYLFNIINLLMKFF